MPLCELIVHKVWNYFIVSIVIFHPLLQMEIPSEQHS